MQSNDEILLLDQETGFLSVSTNKTSILDLKPILKDLISSKLKQSWNRYIFDIELINDLRYDSLNKNEITIECLTKAKRYLKIIDKLIDILNDDFIEFIWNDKIYNSLILEKLFVLYQIGCFYSILAISFYKNNEIKKTGIFFQYSAGLFQLCKVWISKNQNKNTNTEISDFFNNTNQINESNLNLLINIMLSQAQEVYYLTSKEEELKETVLIKISMQISKFYHEILENKFLKLWQSEFFLLKETYYLIISWFNYGKICFKKNKIDEGNYYLFECINKINEINDINNDENRKIIDLIKNIQIEIDKIKIFKDIEIIPQIKDLPKVVLVKNLIPKDLIDNNQINFLNNIVPIYRITKVEEFENQFKFFFENELNKPISVLYDKIQLILKSNNNHDNKSIEFQINDIYTKNLLPPIIIQNKEKLENFGNYDKLNNMHNELIFLKNQCRSELDIIWKLLKSETDEEISLNELYKDSWKLDIIEKDPVGSILIKNFKIYENYMKQSIEGDNLINLQIDELKPFLKLYENENQLNEYIPESFIKELNPDFVKLTDNFLKIIKSLENLNNFELPKFEKKVKIKYENNKLLENYLNTVKNEMRKNEEVEIDDEKNLQDILMEEIMKFSKEVEYIKDEEVKINQLISDYQKNFKEFEIKRDNLRIGIEQKESINVLNSTYNGFCEVLDNLNQGIEFYSNLLGNLKVKKIQLDGFLRKRLNIRQRVINTNVYS